jgi:NAD+ diphosphatase
MLGFLADAEPDAPVAGDELEDVRWFDADEVRDGLSREWSATDDGSNGIVLSAPISIARWLITQWLATQPA